MRLENLVWDAQNPRLLGRFWATALGASIMTDREGLLEARIDLGSDRFLDLCFPKVAHPGDIPQRLHPDLVGGDDQAGVVERLIGLGAERIDVGQGQSPWVVLADPEGNPFCVMEQRETYAQGSGPIAALPLDSQDPERDGVFWQTLLGWRRVRGDAPVSLRHPDNVGPLLELCPEPEPRRGKSTLHLDLRPTTDDPDGVGLVVALGGQVLEQPESHLPWTVCCDPSGNEVCILEPPTAR